jgi:EmrB/QacA subfamily drug resistance transporter
MSYATLDRRTRWTALIVLCLGVLMILVDATIVNVALPTIRGDLGFTETSLVWVVNAYMLTFGGFLLLGGRLGDLFGPRNLFLIGIAGFTLASLGCGMAASSAVLVAARAMQGLGGAVVSAVSFAMIMNMFEEGAERAKALGVYSFVCSGGGAIGLLLGGILTGTLNWHWIFLVNVPIGILVCALCLKVLPQIRVPRDDTPLDVWGAVTVTLSLMLFIYGVAGANEKGWGSGRTLGLLSGAAVLFGTFLLIESRLSKPLVPLSIFRIRNLTIANLVFMLWTACIGAWFYISALYMQLVLGYGPLQIAIAFLPMSLIVAGFSLGLSAKIVTRFGIRAPLSIGILIGALGLALFARVPVEGTLWEDLLPGMILLGLAVGVAVNPLLLAAMRDVAPTETGLASGIINAGSQMGGAMGIALLASVSAARTHELMAAGTATPIALISGYRLAFLLGSVCAGIALLGTFFIHIRPDASSSLSDASDEVRAL